MTSGVPGLKPLAQLWILGICAVFAAVIGFGVIAGMSRQETKHLQPLLERGGVVPGRVVKAMTGKPPKYTVEYQLDFEEDVRRAVIYDAPGVDVERRHLVEPGAPPKDVALLFDPLNPGVVTFADSLDAQREAAVAHLRAWKPRAWALLFAGLLVAAITFPPMKRLADRGGVPLVYFMDDTFSRVRPAEYGRYAGIVGTLGGLLTLVACSAIYFGNASIVQLANRGVPVQGEIIENVLTEGGENGPHRFRVRYSPKPGAPPLEHTTKVLGGIRAERFEVEDGQTRTVALLFDPDEPRRVKLALPMPWELARAREAQWVALVTAAISTVLTLGAVYLLLRCRRVLIDDPPPEPPRSRRRVGRRTQR